MRKKTKIMGYIALLIFSGALLFNGFHLDFNIISFNFDRLMDVIRNTNALVYFILGLGLGPVGLNSGLGQTVQFTNITPKVFITVSPVGLSNGLAFTRNNGADFGIDNLGDPTIGIQTAINAIPTLDYGGLGTQVTLLSGTFNLSNFVLFNQNNSILNITTGASIVLPASKVFVVSTTAIATRMPAIVASQISNSRVTGGGTISQAGSPSFFGAVGLFIADNVTHFEYDHLNFQNISNFAILYSGRLGGSLSTFSQINGHDNTSNNCGAIATPDGGGMRMSWYGSGTTPNNIVISNEVHTNCQSFGYDILGSSSHAINTVTIDNPSLQIVNSTSPQLVGIFFEDPLNGETIYGWQFKAVHISGGTIGVLTSTTVGGTYSDITWTAGIIEQASKDGIKINSQAGTITRWTFTGVICKNNGQSGAGFGGLTIASSGTQNGTISQITVLGGNFVDDQSPKTQSFGFVISITGTGAMVYSDIHLRGLNANSNLTSATSYTITNASASFSKFDTTNCPGINPINLIATMFNTNVNTIGPAGTTAVPVASTAYSVIGAPLIVTATSNAGAIINVLDAVGNAVAGLTNVAALTAQRIPLGYTINFGAFGGSAPTISGVYGE